MTESNNNFHILIVDDTPKNLQLLMSILSKEGYKIHAAQNGIEAMEKAQAIIPDLILLDVMMPEMDGLETCKQLKSSQDTEEIPVIFLTARTETEDIVKGFELGAVDYITKPFSPAELLARVHTHLHLKSQQKKLLQLSQAVEQSPFSIIITDLDGTIEYVNPKFFQISGYSIEEVIGHNPRILKSGEKSSEEYKDLWETITSGNVWCGEFHNKKKNGDLYWELASISPIKNNKGKFTHFIAIKEDITIRKQFEHLIERKNQELSKLNIELKTKNRELELLSTTDQLTGLYNRRFLEIKTKELIARCERFEENLSLILLDIDHFKAVNDNFGHDVGDEVLIKLANVLRDNSRKVDTVGRWGGEEFLILCQTNASNAFIFAEKLRVSIMENKHETVGKITASFGLTQFVEGDSLDTMTKRADQGLYIAKENGRNRIEQIIFKDVEGKASSQCNCYYVANSSICLK